MCGSDAVPQNRANISDRKLSLAGSDSFWSPANVGLLPGRRTSCPAVGFGEYVVVVFPASSVVFFEVHRTTSLSRKVDRNSAGPSGPVSLTPPGSLLTCP